jgi:hypothetical protein
MADPCHTPTKCVVLWGGGVGYKNDLFKNILMFILIFITVLSFSSFIYSKIGGRWGRIMPGSSLPAIVLDFSGYWEHFHLRQKKWLQREADSSTPLSFNFLNEAVSTSDYMVSNNTVINK